MDYKRKILVTGGAGFIGSNFLNKYVVHYPEYLFINIDSLTYAGNLKNILVSKKPNYIFKKIDIRNISALEKAFRKYRPTDIIHFAAESHVDFSIRDSSLFVETNVLGTNNLLLLARKYNINRFHQISTDEVYGSLSKDEPPFTLMSPLAPNSPYSASKAAADMLVRAYNKTYGLNTVITRCSNNYGPFQDKSKLIPKAILKLLRGEKVPIYAKGENIRDWLHVADHIEALDLIFHKGECGKIYNIGGGTEMKNTDLVKMIVEILGKNNDLIEFVDDRKGHDFRYAIDNSPMEKEFSWKPKVSLREGLIETVNFYKNKKK